MEDLKTVGRFLALRNRWLYHVAVKKYLLFRADNAEFILFLLLAPHTIYVLKQN